MNYFARLGVFFSKIFSKHSPLVTFVRKGSISQELQFARPGNSSGYGPWGPGHVGGNGSFWGRSKYIDGLQAVPHMYYKCRAQNLSQLGSTQDSDNRQGLGMDLGNQQGFMIDPNN